MDALEKKYRVPEIYGDYWFNSDPIPLGALRGYIILVNFWAYTNGSSIRSLPYLQEWHRRYKDFGLVVVGVHTPEFSFARDPALVRKAIERLNILYPVVTDNDFLVWSSFRNRVLPTHYLIDKDGFIRYIQAGEGAYQNFEHAIHSLLVEAGYRGELPIVMEPIHEEDKPGAVCYRATPTVFGGYQKGTIGNVEGISPELISHYEDPNLYLEGRLYLGGDWLVTRDYVKLQDEEGKGGTVTVSYRAKEVKAVIKSDGESKFQVFVQQDSRYLLPAEKGDDIRFDSEGRSYLLIGEPKLYSIVKNAEFGEHFLRLITRSNGFVLYAISFVSCVIPELVSNN